MQQNIIRVNIVRWLCHACQKYLPNFIIRLDPDLLRERLIGLEASRQKMQEEYYQKCMLAEEERTEVNCES